MKITLSSDGDHFLALRVAGSGSESDLPDIRAAGQRLEVLRAPDGGGWLAPVPGWLWAMMPDVSAPNPGPNLSLTVVAQGRETEIGLSRTQLLAWLEELAGMAGGADGKAGDYALVAAVEHAHYARLFDALSPGARAALAGAARRIGLAHALPEDMAGDMAGGAKLRPGPTPVVLAVITRLGRAVRAVGDETAPGFLRDLLDELRPDAEARQTLARELVAHFCAIDRVPELYDMLLGEMGAAALQPDWENPWQLGRILPALMLSGRFRAVRDVLTRLAAKPAWGGGDPVAWTLRRLGDPQAPFMPADLFEEVLRAGLAWLDAQAADPRGAIGSVVLRGAAVGLLERRWLCSDALQQEIGRTVMRCYGMSPAFWREVEGQGGQDGDLAVCRQAFERLRANLTGSPEQSAAALADLARLGVHRVARTRIEVLGPYGGSGTSGAALLRGAADPLSPPPPPECEEALAEALRAAMTGLPRNPHGRLRRRMMAEARALLDAAGRGAVDPVAIAALAGGLRRLAGQGTGFVGLMLGLALCRDLPELGALEAAHRLEQAMAPDLRLVVKNAGAAMAGTPGMRAVAARLRALATERPDIAAPALALLADLPEDLRAVAPAGPTQGPALFDTLVVVCSCRAHLDSRVAGLRAGWLGDLARFGIPHVILTGGEQTLLQGDVLQVEAPDSYEGLPRKILKMVEWVEANTGYGHLLKIDDDCHLDVAAYFLDPAWRQFDYYGRRLEKTGARIDRVWHQSRSASAAARLGFEKLPDHALYADGGTGYALSRTAMRALLREGATLRGQALTAAAFSEDKLVGALLGQAGITPRDEDYHSAVFRRPTPDGRAVPAWVSGFQPNRLGVAKVVHLDAGADMADAARLEPPRIWPTHAAPKLGFNSGAAHLLSSRARLAEVADADVAVISVIRNEAAMLRHFLAHYRRLGVGGFLIVDNGSDDGSVEYLADQPDVALFSADTEFRAVEQGSDWKRALLAHYRRDRWALVADADELLLYPGHRDMTLADWLARYRDSDIDAVRLFMLDMYPRGALAGADMAGAHDPFEVAGFADRRAFLATSLGRGPYDNSPTWTSALRHRLMPGARPDLFVAQKVALVKYRPWMHLSDSLHYANEVVLAPDELLLAHFKYHAGFAAHARTEVARRQHFNDAEEYRRYLALTGAGREVLFDAALSVPWEQSDAARDLLGG